MEEFIGFFSSLWRDWLGQSPANRVAIAVTLLLPIAGWIWSMLRVGSKSQRIDRLEKENASLTQERNAALKSAEQERRFAGQWMPERWLEAAARERRDGNEEKAVEALRIGIANVAPGLASAARELAGHYLSLMAERDPAAALEEAARHARLAVLLEPTDRDVARLMEEIAHARADLGEAVPDEDLAHVPLPSDPDEAGRLIGAILERENHLLTAGKYTLAWRLLSRGVLVARRAGLFDSDVGFVVRQSEARAQSFAGDAAGALEKVRGLLPIQEYVQGAEHPDVLETRFLEARLLWERGGRWWHLRRFRRYCR